MCVCVCVCVCVLMTVFIESGEAVNKVGASLWLSPSAPFQQVTHFSFLVFFFLFFFSFLLLLLRHYGDYVTIFSVTVDARPGLLWWYRIHNYPTAQARVIHS